MYGVREDASPSCETIRGAIGILCFVRNRYCINRPRARPHMKHSRVHTAGSAPLGNRSCCRCKPRLRCLKTRAIQVSSHTQRRRIRAAAAPHRKHETRKRTPRVTHVAAVDCQYSNRAVGQQAALYGAAAAAPEPDAGAAAILHGALKCFR
jgi:hypothetical protein